MGMLIHILSKAVRVDNTIGGIEKYELLLKL